MVVVVPEHGGALKGDKMQVSGLRDIPSPSITNVPTAVKFFGMKAPHEGAPIIIDQPSSYLAVSELVVRALDGKCSARTASTGSSMSPTCRRARRCPRTPTPSSSSIRASLMSS